MEPAWHATATSIGFRNVPGYKGVCDDYGPTGPRLWVESGFDDSCPGTVSGDLVLLPGAQAVHDKPGSCGIWEWQVRSGPEAQRLIGRIADDHEYLHHGADFRVEDSAGELRPERRLLSLRVRERLALGLVGPRLVDGYLAEKPLTCPPLEAKFSRGAGVAAACGSQPGHGEQDTDQQPEE